MKRKRKSYNTRVLPNGHEVWSRIPDSEKITDSHIGKRVWIAGEFKTKKAYISEVHKKGEPGWKDGGVLVKCDPFDRCFLVNKVRLHPIEIKKRRS